MSRKFMPGAIIAAVLVIGLILLRQALIAPASGTISRNTAAKPAINKINPSLPSSRRVTAMTTPAPGAPRIIGRTDSRPTATTRTLSGRVTLIDGTPLAGAVVSANFNTSATTDASGNYQLTHLPSQVWGVNASHQDAMTSSVRRLSSDQATLDFMLRRKSPVKFVAKVINAVSREPVADFSVAIEEREAIKNATIAGEFEITKVFTGDQLRFKLLSPNSLTREVREYIPADASGTVEREYAIGSGGTVKGRVVRGKTKAPVEGVRVAMRSFGDGGPGGGGWGGRDRGRRDNATSTTTGADGKFEITRLSPGPIILQLQPERPLLDAMRFAGELQHNEIKDVGDLEIGEGGTIKGRLVKVPGNHTMADVRIELRGSRRGGRDDNEGDSNTSSTTTDAGGEFTFAPVEPGQHQLTVRNFRIRESVTVNAEETREVVLRVGSGTLKGLVVKKDVPVPGAEVTVSRSTGGGFFDGWGGNRGLNSVDTAEDGTFEIKDLTPGNWSVNIDPDNAREGDFEVVIPNEGVLEKTFPLPSGNLVGKVVDSADQPVAGASVSIVSSSESSQSGGGDRGGFGGRGGRRGIQTGADGTFRIEDRAPGAISVQARKDGVGYSDVVETQLPEQGDSQEVLLKIGTSEKGTLVSTAMNLDTGGPIANAYCNLTNAKGRVSHSQRRGEDGVITIPDLPVGTYNVEVGAMGYTTSEQTVEIKANETAQITDVLNAAGSFRLSVIDSNGAGVAGATCQLSAVDPDSIQEPKQGTTTDAGVWLVRGILPGQYMITVTTADGRASSAQVNIATGSFSQESAVLQ